MLFKGNQKKKKTKTKTLKSKALVFIKPMLQGPGNAVLMHQISMSDLSTSNYLSVLSV